MIGVWRVQITPNAEAHRCGDGRWILLAPATGDGPDATFTGIAPARGELSYIAGDNLGDLRRRGVPTYPNWSRAVRAYQRGAGL